MSERTAHVLEQKWRSDDIKIGEDADFSSLLLPEDLLKGLTLAGFKYPSPIQLKAIPVGKIGKDLIVQAKSGTGKTLVFSVVALNMLMKGAKHPQVLIMAPTREIACQICQVIKHIGFAYKDFACEYFIGGRKLEEDVPRIQGCQVIVGTPGRINQMINCKILKTAGIRLFVLDEADQLLKESSFIPDINCIFRALPRDKQMIATSATYPGNLKRLTNKFFRDPLLIRLNKKDIGLLGMVHYYHVIPVSKLPVVAYKAKLKFLEYVMLNVKFAQCLVFCNMVSRVENLCVEIKKWGFAATYISSAREQKDRLIAIELLKKFKCKVLVSSDVSARGIDAENVDLVINFDLPTFLEIYFHRVGRAGRYGSKCASITFVTSDEIEAYQRMQCDGKFESYILPDHVPTGLISLQPKMKPIENDRELPFDDEVESSSASSNDTEDLNEDGVVKQEKANGFIEDIKLNGHNELCTSKDEEFISENLANPSDEELVDSEAASTESRDSHGMQNQLLDLNSNPTSSVKEYGDLVCTLESVELESDNTDSLSSVELKQQEVGIELGSTEIVAVEKENDELKINESISEGSYENDKLVGRVLDQRNSETSVIENFKNNQSDKFPNNIPGLQQIIDTSSCLADTESISEKTLKETINDKSLVGNNKCNVSEILNNPNSSELVSSVVTFIKEYENLNKDSEEYFIADSIKSPQSVKVETNDKFSSRSLEYLESNLNKYRYNVCKDFIGNILISSINDIAPGCGKEKIVNQVPKIGDSKIQDSSLDSRYVLFSTPKTEVPSGSKSDHSSGVESNSGSDKDKLVEHFNLMVGSIHKVKPSCNKNSTSESSSSSESNSDTSVNSGNAMYKLTKEFNKVTKERAGSSIENKGKVNIINNTELSSSSDSDSGTSIDSEKTVDELEKEFTKLIMDKRNDEGSSKDTKEAKKILQEIKHRKKCFKGIEIVDFKKHAKLSSNTSDSDDDTKKHPESSSSDSDDTSSDDCADTTPVGSSSSATSDTDSEEEKEEPKREFSKMIQNKRNEVSNTIKSSKSSGRKTKTINGPAQNKITYYNHENEIDQHSKESHSSFQSGHQRKTCKKGKVIREKTINGPVQNKITYYSGPSSSDPENDIDQYSEEPHSNLQGGHQRKRKTHKKDETLPKTVPSRFNYSNANGTSSPYLNPASYRPISDPPQSNYQIQPTNYASNQYYQPFPQQIQGHANYGLFSGVQSSHQVEPTHYASNSNYQAYPQQIQGHANYGLFSGVQSGHQREPTHASNSNYQAYPQQIQNHASHGLFSGTQSSRQMEPTSFASYPYCQPYPSECPLKESCQMSKMQSVGNEHTASCSTGNSHRQRNPNPSINHVQSNYQMQPSNYAYNNCSVPSQHLCHLPNVYCQSPACAAWYDIFYKQWQFCSRSSYF